MNRLETVMESGRTFQSPVERLLDDSQAIRQNDARLIEHSIQMRYSTQLLICHQVVG